MARDDEKIAELMRVLAEDIGEAQSLFLPIVPLRKFPPPDSYEFTSALLINIVSDIAMQAVFPFKFGKTSSPINSETAFHKYIAAMRKDKELVLKIPVKITIDGPRNLDTDLKIEYTFSSKLLDRIYTIGEIRMKERPYFYYFLLDLMTQAVHYQDKLNLTKDDTGNHWLRIRDQFPYRSGGFFSDVTILVNSLRQLVRCIFAEKDSDIDNWYTHEWMSPIIQERLSLNLSTSPIQTNQQAGIFSRFFQKFSKVLTKDPG